MIYSSYPELSLLSSGARLCFGLLIITSGTPNPETIIRQDIVHECVSLRVNPGRSHVGHTYVLLGFSLLLLPVAAVFPVSNDMTAVKNGIYMPWLYRLLVGALNHGHLCS